MSPDSNPDFEVFVNRTVPMSLAVDPFVTIQKRGLLSINLVAYRLLGSPRAVELLYNAKDRVVGLRSADEGLPHVYPLRAVNGKDDGPFVISATAFVKYFHIPVEVSRRWVATAQDGMLLVDLASESVTVTSNRAADSRRRPSA